MVGRVSGDLRPRNVMHEYWTATDRMASIPKGDFVSLPNSNVSSVRSVVDVAFIPPLQGRRASNGKLCPRYIGDDQWTSNLPL